MQERNLRTDYRQRNWDLNALCADCVGGWFREGKYG